MRDHDVDGRPLFYRELGSGGYVEIVVRAARDEAERQDGALVGELVLERRAAGPRRALGRPPVLCRSAGPSVVAVLDGLFPIAMSDVALAQLATAMRRPRESTGRPSGPRRSPGGVRLLT